MSAVKGATHRVRIEDGRLFISWANEAELRAGLARVARAYGWWVREEVVVPGWGRIDLVLRRSVTTRPYLVELKVRLGKPNEVRRAFQQADGYGRWWTKHHAEANTSMVCSPKPNMDIIQPVADAYPAVPYYSVADLLGGLCSWNVERARIDAAAARLAELRSELLINEHASNELKKLATAADENAAWAANEARNVDGVDA